MVKKTNTKRYTAAELDALRARGEDKTNWALVDSMSEEELERRIAEDPDSDPPVDWSTATITIPANKQGVYLRLDPHVLDFFRSEGPGYQTRINAVLRTYVEQMQKRNTKKTAAE